MRAWCLIVVATLAVSNANASQCLDSYVHLATVRPNLDRTAAAPLVGERAPRLSEVKAGRALRDHFDGKPLRPELKARPAATRPNPQWYTSKDAEFREIVVKFLDDSLAKSDKGQLALPDKAKSARLAASLSGFKGLNFAPAVEGGEDWLTALRYCAAVNTGIDHADLTSLFSATIPEELKVDVHKVITALLDHPDVESAWVRGPTVLTSTTWPPTDIGTMTPQFESEQQHWNGAPMGINIRSSWPVAGVKGEGLRYVDLEHEWEAGHEDFYMPSNQVLGMSPADLDNRKHGTAVVGMLSAQHNGYGYNGGVPSAEAWATTTSAESQPSRLIRSAPATRS